MTKQKIEHLKERFFNECTDNKYLLHDHFIPDINIQAKDVWRWIENNCLQQTKDIAIEFKIWVNDHAWEYEFKHETTYTEEELFDIFINQRNQ